MRVKELHPLCCVSLESPHGIGDDPPDTAAPLTRSRSLPATAVAAAIGGSDGKRQKAAGSEAETVAGILYKWTNFGKGWRSRWFLLRNGILSYSKIRRPENMNLLSPAEDVRLIGDISTSRLSRMNSCSGRRKQHKTVGIVHLKAANLEAEASGIHDSVYQLTKHGFSSLGRGKYSECSTTASSDDIEKQEFEDVSEEDEPSFHDTKEYFAESDVGSECTNIKRRTKLPDPVEKEKGVSLWSMIKDNVGKDLTRVCLPVYFNEPISSLQKCFEDLEYSYLLDRAYEYGKSGNSLLRALNVAAFAVSGYASTEGRHCKPFNPLLGETYEADYPEKGVHFFSEKVSHHPTVIACHCEGKGWKFWGDTNLRSKFWGRSIQVDPDGVLTLEFDDGEMFQWSKVTTTIYNIILGKLYCDHHGVMEIRGNRQYSCTLKFKEQSILDRNPHQVNGFVEDVNGKKAATIFGKWDDSIYYAVGDGISKTKVADPTVNDSLLWKRTKPPPNLTRYNLTSFAITLNELTPGLQIKEKLPPTDSRLRPDQRHLENGEYEKANGEKQRLERRQRMSRKLQESGWRPRWFERDGENGTFKYTGGYWEARKQRSWVNCPDIFGEFTEEL
ncbi:PREDICTED: oxysterol-binding protein-related protein 2A-like isoform X6 [Tarenaya hassleriana]|uniref:oxysterol-binding protein-related protein 2A-like isoform X6 n=1 Tax=Tarenaya hassleriana TaxID=28532 RepID=UPI00053C6588|nr:PREDICTED: oxysterol-binding protein-related protein 2A-like isoform X6 [Tarenaya hassleriana]